ncbi:hypothetical protein SCHPADRAFT_939693 [Schizopora paradoxa]|uniref:RING-type domain-containing protein n=1 Tax=Schizopora paradoxa TaxID=27342 RepID=A0A0H2RRP9_9AGAM|nr:hypothetical protein SCHPADRAFT_939693 [Schizopora paradoxa]
MANCAGTTRSRAHDIVFQMVFCLGFLAVAVMAYIPAMPTNQTDAINGAINQSDTSMLQLQWFPNASFGETVSYQLVGEDSTGISRGALVHFSEANLTLGFDKTPDTDPDTDPNDQPTPNIPDYTSTPWIAFVSCDANSTNSTNDIDIFTLAKNRGAVAALLYSEWSDACLINAHYADPAIFNQVFDIFSTKSLIAARTVENAFTNVNQTLYSNFNATMLNMSASIINESMANNSVPTPSYLFATLTANNASIPGSGQNGDGSSSSSSGGGSKNTDLAMIVLYVITGAVSVLFCIVILSGAIRAIRHPERYGPRPADPTMGEYTAQSRARGLTRAILDTFPVIKFSAQGTTAAGLPKPSGSDSSMEMGDLAPGAAAASMPIHSDDMDERNERQRSAHGGEDPQGDYAVTADEAHPSQSEKDAQQVAESSTSASRRSTGSSGEGAGASAPGAGASPSPDPNAVVPAAIGRETCPICIVDFEEGDDLRVLPCEGKHVFHQQCVDPWLLELSSSCPICRHDFHALEEMIAGTTESDIDNHLDMPPHHPTSHGAGSRFSRYLRFARGRRANGRQWGNRDSITEDPTDPPYPLAPEHREG